MTDKKDIKNKISNVLDSLKDLDTMEIEGQIDEENQLFDYSNLLNNISDNPEMANGVEIGPWKIIRLIGRGGMSIVYLVERNDKQLKQQAALKVIPNGLANKNMIDRFMRERQILSDLNHPNIAQLFDAGVTDQGVPWFVMEYIQGEDIISYAENNQLNIEQRIFLIKQVCEALTYAHAHGVVHRDIKPNNLMVNDDKVIKLLDFGIASSEEQQSLTMTGAVIGTPGYMSPEQAKGLTDEIDRRTDIFSLGVLLYKLIKHDMPFRAESISEISYKIIHDEPMLLGNQVPVELQAITFKCLEKKVENRYSSVKRLQDDLDAYLRGDVVSARKVTLFGRLAKKIKKHPVLSGFIIVAILSTIMGIGYGIYQSFESVRKLQVSEKYLDKTQDLKAKIRRIHMMPLHSILYEYTVVEKEIEELRTEIENNDIDHSGLSYFALGSAYYNLKKTKKALSYFRSAESKGWKSKELSTGLGLSLLANWRADQDKAKLISNKDEKKIFLDESKKNNYFPSLTYLRDAKKGATDVNYLAAELAFLEEKFDEALGYAESEIKINPWHYEALNLSSKIYLAKFKKQGRAEGYDVALKTLELSNQQLDKAINIGRSDPYNYIARCTNASIDVQIIKLLRLNNKFPQAYDKGVEACLNAQSLFPESNVSWNNLNQIYVTKGFWLEANAQDSTDEYIKALDVVEDGLEKHPDNAMLMSRKIKPLLHLAENTVKQNNDPNPFYLQALEVGKKALSLNPKQGKIMFELARVELTYGQYQQRVVGDFEKAEHYYKLSLENFIKKQDNNPSIANVLNISALEINLYQVKLSQKNIPEAINYLQQSLDRRIEVLPKRIQYFDNFKDLLEEKIDLFELTMTNGGDIDGQVVEAVSLMNEICQLDGLSQEQTQFINQLMHIYVENKWLKSMELNSCQ